MNQADPPTSVGVFKPIGFFSDVMVWYAADEMRAKISAQLPATTRVANSAMSLT